MDAQVRTKRSYKEWAIPAPSPGGFPTAGEVLWNYVPVFVTAGLGFVMVWATLQLTKLIGPRRLVPGKLSTYESGEVPVGSARGPIDVQYYMYVLIFLIIDIEAVFMIPWALSLTQDPAFIQSVGIGAYLFEMVIFVVIVLAGWVYAWRKGALQWQS